LQTKIKDAQTRSVLHDPERDITATYPIISPKGYTTYGKNAPPFYETLADSSTNISFLIFNTFFYLRFSFPALNLFLNYLIEVPNSNTLFQSIKYAKDTAADSWKRCGTFLFCSSIKKFLHGLPLF
jgi:hypothetical protein